MLSHSVDESPSIRAATYCTWTRGERFFCLLEPPAYNMIHTTELNEDTHAQHNHINKDNDNTQIEDVDVENMQREKEEGRGEKEVKALADV